MNKGVRWFIRYVTDTSSRAKTIKESEDAARRSGQKWKQEGRASSRNWFQEFKRNFRLAENESRRSANKVSGVWGGMLTKLGILFGGTFAAYKITQFTREVVKLGVDSEETASKFETTFGSAAGKMQDFVQTYGRMAGLSQDQARDATATIGAMGQGMGFTQQEAADLSIQVLKTAGDLTSFNNIPIADTTRAIRSAIVGEREALKTLGIAINQTDLDQRAMAMSGKSSADALTQQERAAATLVMIQERMGPALGDLVRTQNSNANAARRAAGDWLTFKEMLGVALTQVSSGPEIIGAVGDTIAKMTDFVRDNSFEITKWTDVTLRTFSAVVVTVSQFVRSLFNAGQAIGNGFMAFASLVMLALTDAGNTFGNLINTVIEQINRIPGVDIDFRFNGMDTSHWYDQMTASAAAANDQFLQGDDAVRRIADAWKAVYTSATAAEKAVDAAADANKNADEGPKPPTPEEVAKAMDAEIDRLTKGHELRILNRQEQERVFGLEQALTEQYRQSNLSLDERIRILTKLHAISAVAGDIRSKSPLASVGPVSLRPIEATGRLTTDPETMRALTEVAREESANIEGAFVNAAHGISDAFRSAFLNIGDEGSNLGSFMVAIARGLAAALVGSVAQYASVKVGENVASGFENLANASAAAAKFNPVSAGLFTNAARGNFFAAGKWALLAGAAGAGAAAIGGGGGGGGGGRFGGSRGNREELDQAASDRAAIPELHFHIRPFDKHNPVIQDEIGEANMLFGRRAGIKFHTESS